MSSIYTVLTFQKIYLNVKCQFVCVYTVINKLGYAASVTAVYENSLAEARLDTQSSPEYIAGNGDVSSEALYS